MVKNDAIEYLTKLSSELFDVLLIHLLERDEKETEGNLDSSWLAERILKRQKAYRLIIKLADSEILKSKKKKLDKFSGSKYSVLATYVNEYRSPIDQKQIIEKARKNEPAKCECLSDEQCLAYAANKEMNMTLIEFEKKRKDVFDYIKSLNEEPPETKHEKTWYQQNINRWQSFAESLSDCKGMRPPILESVLKTNPQILNPYYEDNHVTGRYYFNNNTKIEIIANATGREDIDKIITELAETKLIVNTKGTVLNRRTLSAYIHRKNNLKKTEDKKSSELQREKHQKNRAERTNKKIQ